MPCCYSLHSLKVLTCWFCVCGRENKRLAFIDSTFYIYILILSSLLLLWAAAYEWRLYPLSLSVWFFAVLCKNKSPSGSIKSKTNLNPQLKQEFCHHVSMTGINICTAPHESVIWWKQRTNPQSSVVRISHKLKHFTLDFLHVFHSNKKKEQERPRKWTCIE